MPSSTLDIIEAGLQLIIDVNPRSLLDLGVGFGKWGFLSREYLETYRHKVYARADWKVRIDGLEAFKPYLQDHQRAIYDKLYIRDLDDSVTHSWLGATRYQLYLAMDVLEHLHNWRAVLNAIPRTSAIIAATPDGVSVQGPVFKNVRESHVTTFCAADLVPYFDEVRVVKNKLLCFRDMTRK
jgi:hypothetical protein